mgnify:CR=1 FL=1
MILTLLIKCFFIGIAASIPMGPLGVVCIQRTINRGRQHGFVTGLGAASSDLVYASLIGFSMSFVLDFIEANSTIISLISFAIIILFGILTFLKSPKQFTESKTTSSSNNSLLKDYASALGLCISNPMISVFFIALFAQFEVFTNNQPFYISLLTLVFIFCSSMTCWGVLSFFVDKFRDRFNEKGITYLNRFAGSLLTIIGFWGICNTIIKNWL